MANKDDAKPVTGGYDFGDDWLNELEEALDFDMPQTDAQKALMKKIYEKSFNELLELVRDSRDDSVRRTEEFVKAKNSVLNLGDARFISYSNMVGTSEIRAVKVIERLAVSLIEDR